MPWLGTCIHNPPPPHTVPFILRSEAVGSSEVDSEAVAGERGKNRSALLQNLLKLVKLRFDFAVVALVAQTEDDKKERSDDESGKQFVQVKDASL